MIKKRKHQHLSDLTNEFLKHKSTLTETDKKWIDNLDIILKSPPLEAYLKITEIMTKCQKQKNFAKKETLKYCIKKALLNLNSQEQKKCKLEKKIKIENKFIFLKQSEGLRNIKSDNIFCSIYKVGQKIKISNSPTHLKEQ